MSTSIEASGVLGHPPFSSWPRWEYDGLSAPAPSPAPHQKETLKLGHDLPEENKAKRNGGGVLFLTSISQLSFPH